MDDKLARRFLDELTKLRKAQERTADALEAANRADPLAMIQEALGAGSTPQGGQDGATGHQDAVFVPRLTPEEEAYVRMLKGEGERE